MQNMIDIHWARSGSVLPPGEEFLSAEEVEKYSNFRFPQRRAEWLLGRWTAKRLLQTSIEQFSGLSLSDWTVANEADGRPYAVLAGMRLPGCLSISHRSGQAVCAWSSNGNINLGIDLETIEPRTDAFIEDYFTKAEQVLSRGRQRERDAVLIWSAKEAMLKAMGMGLRVDTRSVEVLRITADEVFTDWHALDVRSLVQPELKWRAVWQTVTQTMLTLAVCAEQIQGEQLHIREALLY